MSYLVPKTILSDVVFDLDDFYPQATAMTELLYLKWKYPKFKVTLFAIPCKDKMVYGKFLNTISQTPWIQLAPHGMFHDSVQECSKWNYGESIAWLKVFEDTKFFQRIFKAPGWNFSNDLYKALMDAGWVCADIEDNKEKWPEKLKVYSTAHPWCVHGHTWNLNNPDPSYNNGIAQIIERGVPWDEKSEFYFISELKS